ncbi:MAG: ATP-binding protein, partial [Muribaculaceae bacterium]|nr:ATP-binding protein [Muribaculaceae bacterium]
MEYLKLHNFGPISDLDITLKKVNIFIGEQGVGKSTLAKLLSCCRDFVLYYVIVHNMGEKLIKHIFSTYGIHTYFKEDTYIEYYDSDGIKLNYKNGRFSLSHKTYDEIKIIKYVDQLVIHGVEIAYGKLIGGIGGLTQEDVDKILKDNSRIIFSNLRTSFYCPAERGIAGVLSNSLATLLLSETPLPQPLIEYMSFFEKARKEYASFDIPFMHLKYSYEDGKNMVKVDSDSVQLQYASSGIQSILPLLMVIEYCLQKNYFSSFTIEEPELNLFPTNQFHLLQTL